MTEYQIHTMKQLAERIQPLFDAGGKHYSCLECSYCEKLILDFTNESLAEKCAANFWYIDIDDRVVCSECAVF